MLKNDVVVVIGASGFGRECLDVLEAMNATGASNDIIGVVDDSPSQLNLQRLEERRVSYLGTISEWLSSRRVAKYLLGIGDPRIRRRLVTRLDEAGAVPAIALHPGATLGAATILAPGVVVCAGAAISNNVQIGRHVHVNPNATIGHDAKLAAFVSINPAAVISGDVEIEEEALLGAASTVLQQRRIGYGAIVGAGAVVTKDVLANTIVRGIPAR